MRSRHEVGEILRESADEVIEFRAGMIVGAGSLSFELLKSLTDRLPVMICPKWPTTPTQPVAVDTPASFEVGRHLIEGLKNPTVVRDAKALQAFSIRPMSVKSAIQKAIESTTG